jgi:hypothetical protein
MQLLQYRFRPSLRDRQTPNSDNGNCWAQMGQFFMEISGASIISQRSNPKSKKMSLLKKHFTPIGN